MRPTARRATWIILVCLALAPPLASRVVFRSSADRRPEPAGASRDASVRATDPVLAAAAATTPEAVLSACGDAEASGKIGCFGAFLRGVDACRFGARLTPTRPRGLPPRPPTA